MEQKNFILSMDYKDIVNDLSDGQAGILIKAIFEYVATGDVSESLKDRELKMAFRFITRDLDYNKAKWEETIEARRQAGLKSGETRRTKRTNVNFVEQKPTKRTNVNFVEHTVVDVVTDVVCDNDITTTTKDSSASPAVEDYSAQDFEEAGGETGIPVTGSVGNPTTGPVEITTSKKIVEIWNAFAAETGLPKVLEISESRRRKLQARLVSERFDVEKIIEAIRGQPALISGLGVRGWRVNFDWLIENDKNYLKVLEHNYADGKVIGARPKENSRAHALETYRRHIESKIQGVQNVSDADDKNDT